jgi:hypothetical protein
MHGATGARNRVRRPNLEVEERAEASSNNGDAHQMPFILSYSHTHRYARAYSTPSRCSCISLPLDPGGTTRNPDIQDSDSIYMTVSSSVPRLLDLSLPPSLSSSDSFYLSYQKCREMLPANTDSRSLRALHTGILAPVLRRFHMLTYFSAVRSRTNYTQC